MVLRLFIALLLAWTPLLAAQAKLAWDAPSFGAPPVGYNVYRSTTQGVLGAKVNTALITTLPTSSAPFIDSTVPNTGQRFFYVVRAVNAAGVEGPVSNEVFFVEGAGPPVNLRVVP